MIREEYVSFETAQMLKEAGFECNLEYYYDKHGNVEPSLYADNDDYPRPTQAIAARWIREVHRIVVDAFFIPPSEKEDEWKYFICKMDDLVLAGDFVSSKFTYKTYEQAMELGLQEALGIIKERGIMKKIISMKNSTSLNL